MFAADTGTGAVRRVTETAGSTPANGTSFDLAVSGDGRWVAFTTDATNLATPDTNGFRDIVVADLQTGSFQRASVPSGPPTNQSNLHSSEPSLSFDGCLIAFRSDASNLVAPDPGPGVTEVFARNRCTSETEVVRSTTPAPPAPRPSRRSPTTVPCRVPQHQRQPGAELGPRCGHARPLWRVDDPPGPLERGRAIGDRRGGAAPVGRHRSLRGVLLERHDLVPGDTVTIDAYVRDRAINARPVAELVLGQSGRSVTADARASRDADGPAVTGSIAWGDGSADSPGVLATHDYARGGSYAVTVTITDVDGATSTKTLAVTVPDSVGPPPAAPSGSGGGGGEIPGGPRSQDRDRPVRLRGPSVLRSWIGCRCAADGSRSCRADAARAAAGERT